MDTSLAASNPEEDPEAGACLNRGPNATKLPELAVATCTFHALVLESMFPAPARDRENGSCRYSVVRPMRPESVESEVWMEGWADSDWRRTQYWKQAGGAYTQAILAQVSTAPPNAIEKQLVTDKDSKGRTQRHTWRSKLMVNGQSVARA